MSKSGKRIGILTGGGDCPGLNAVIRGAVKSADRLGYNMVGFINGFEGLVDPVAYKPLNRTNTSGILHQGGTILGTTNKGRFTARAGIAKRVEIAPELLAAAKKTVEQLGLLRPDLRGGRWLAGHRAAIPRIRHSGGGRAQDDRQRSFGDGIHIWVRQRGGLRYGCTGPVAHHGCQPWADDGAGGDGPARRLDCAARGHRRWRQRDPDSRNPLEL